MQNRTDISASAKVVSGSYPTRPDIVVDELMQNIRSIETLQGLKRVLRYTEAQAEERRQRRALGLDDKFQMTPRKVSNDTPLPI